MPHRFDFDGTLKELFQQDRPTLLGRLTRGIAIKEFVNVELPKVQQRRVDLLIALADGTLLHVEFQSARDRHIAYRMLEYRALIQRRYARPLRQMLLFVGKGAARPPDGIRQAGLSFRYEVMDLREIQADELIRTGNTGDLALAVLAGGADARVRDIVRRAAPLKRPQRDKLLTKILVLAALRGLAEKVEWELKHMPVMIDIDDIPMIRHVYREAEAKGRAEGEAKGRAEGEAKGRAEGEAKGEAKGEARGKAKALHALLEAKFPPLPRWASLRVSQAGPAQVERWIKKVLNAETLEGVLGPRHRNGS
jgi:predicted transposase YdaD